MKIYLRTIIIICLLLVNSLIYSQELQKVSLQLQWKHQFEFAGFYVAKEKGYYKEVGLDVDFYTYEKGMNVVGEVVSQNKDFGIGNPDMIQALVEGEPIVLMTNYLKRSPFVIVTTPDIHTPTDLIGKKLILSKFEKKNVSYLKMLSNFNIQPDEIDGVLPSDFSSGSSSHAFIAGEADAYMTYSTNSPYVLKQNGISYNILDPGNYSTKMYDVNLFTSKDFLLKNNSMVHDFAKASTKGWEYTASNKEEIVDLVYKKYNTFNVTRDEILFQADEILRMMEIDNSPIGSININQIQKMGILLSDKGLPQILEGSRNFVYMPSVSKEINFTPEEKEFLKNHPVIRSECRDDVAPISFMKNGIPNGYSIDFRKLLADKMGIKIEYVGGHIFSEYIGMLKDKKIDILSSIIQTPERDDYALFTIPVKKIPPEIISHKGNLYTSLDDLPGQTVTILKGYWLIDLLREYYPSINIDIKDTLSEAIRAVSSGKAAATIGSGYILQRMWEEQRIDNVVISGNVKIPDYYDYSHRIGIRDDWPLLQSALNKAINSVTFTEDRVLKKKWFYSQDNKDTFFSNLTIDEKIYLNKKKTVKISGVPYWLPYESISVDGKYTGIVADIFHLIESRTGLEFEVVHTKNWQETIYNMETRKCDIIPLAIPTEKRKQHMDFTEVFLTVPFVIATKVNEIFIENVESIIDKKLAITRGYVYIETLRKKYPSINIIEVENLNEGFKKLRAGEVFGLIDSLGTIAYAIQSEGMVDIKISHKLGENLLLSVASRNDEPLLNSIMQKAIDSVSENEKRTIYNNWISVIYEDKINYTMIWKIIGISLIIVLFLFLWIRQLSISRKQIKSSYEQQSILHHKLEIIAVTDPLTGLYNRVKINNFVDSELNRAKRYLEPFTIIILDIDFFKKVNDTYGHQVGDIVLREIASTLKDNSRETDIVARWGGEEFMIICPKTEIKGALTLAENIRKQIESHEFTKAGKETVSIGVTSCRKNDSEKTIIARADEALYIAKKNGRNRVETV